MLIVCVVCIEYSVDFIMYRFLKKFIFMEFSWFVKYLFVRGKFNVFFMIFLYMFLCTD